MGPHRHAHRRQLHAGTVGDVAATPSTSSAWAPGLALRPPTGDGILLSDTAGGSGTLTVAEGSSTTPTAAPMSSRAPGPRLMAPQRKPFPWPPAIPCSLGICRSTDAQRRRDRLDYQRRIELSDRLLLTSNQLGGSSPGAPGRGHFGGGGMRACRWPNRPAANALLAWLSASSILISSASNSFTNVLPGATVSENFTVRHGPAGVADRWPIHLTHLVAAVQAMVNDYNSFQSALAQDTSYDTSSNSGAVLASDPTATQLGAGNLHPGVRTDLGVARSPCCRSSA